MTQRRGRADGFTLIELSVVLVIIGLVLGMGLTAMGGWLEGKRREATQDRLDAIVEALVVYASQHRRLPCPADATDAGTAEAGREQREADESCTDAQQNGIVPWVTLGLREADALDGWTRLFTYRVDDHPTEGLTRDGGLDMSDCDPAAAADGTPETDCGADVAPLDFLLNKGVRTADADGGNILNQPGAGTGAAFVVVSHGPNASYAYGNNGNFITGIGAVGDDEALNRNDKAVTEHLAGGGDAYVDRLVDESGTSSQFDDILRRPSITWLAVKAGLGPRKPAS